jgi:hypothetical protein
MLIHAKSKWPQEISANLWPYAMRMANEANNVTPNMNDKHRRSPMELFLQTRELLPIPSIGNTLVVLCMF